MGLIRIPEFNPESCRIWYAAVAITDHGKTCTVRLSFIQAAQKAGINRIIGCEVYMAPGAMTDRARHRPEMRRSTLQLLAQDLVG